MTGLQIVDGTAFVKTQLAPLILIMQQYAYYGRQWTIHSSGQIEAYKNYVKDQSMKVSVQVVASVLGPMIDMSYQ